MTSSAVLTEYNRRNGVWFFSMWRVRIIAISGTTPEPPAMSVTGTRPGRQTNQPPTGPRSSHGSPTFRMSVRYGETSPPSTRCTVSSTRLPSAAEAIE
jgi:hypothetical protein